jgi:hypothetical protein
MSFFTVPRVQLSQLSETQERYICTTIAYVGWQMSSSCLLPIGQTIPGTYFLYQTIQTTCWLLSQFSWYYLYMLHLCTNMEISVLTDVGWRPVSWKLL